MQLVCPLAVTVEIRALDVAGNQRWWRLSQEIGEDGVRLESDVPLEPGRPVRVEFLLPSSEPPEPESARRVQAVGIVKEVRPDGNPRAIAFTSIEEVDRLRLGLYMQERMLLT